MTKEQKVKIKTNISDPTENTDTRDYSLLIGETPYRFIIVLIYCFLSFANGMQWVTFSAIAKEFKTEYDLTQYQVDLFSTIYMIIYPFLSFPSSYIIDNKNMGLGVFNHNLA
jgi:fucose permease